METKIDINIKEFKKYYQKDRIDHLELRIKILKRKGNLASEIWLQKIEKFKNDFNININDKVAEELDILKVELYKQKKYTFKKFKKRLEELRKIFDNIINEFHTIEQNIKDEEKKIDEEIKGEKDDSIGELFDLF